MLTSNSDISPVKETSIRHDLAVRLAGLPAEEIKQAVIKWLDMEAGELPDLERNLLSVEAGEKQKAALSPAERAAAFTAWAESHRRGLPLLSDEAISRESIYENERL